MKSTAMMPMPAPGVDALIKQARRRQRRRYAFSGVAVATAIAAALGAFAGLRGPRGPGHASQPLHARSATGHSSASRVPAAIPRSVDTTVLMWPRGSGQDGTIAMDNLRTGKLAQAAPVADPGLYQPIMMVGGRIIYVTSNGVQAADAVTGKSRSIGTALAFAPSATHGDVWLEYGTHDPTAPVTVRHVPVSGGRPGSPITLPSGTQLVAGTDSGLLLEPHGGEVGGPFWLWTPGIAPGPLPDSTAAEGFAVSARLVAYGSHCANPSTSPSLSYGGNFGFYTCRTIRVLDVVTGRLLSFAAPPGTTGWAPTHGGNWAWSASEIAPSGQLMAAQAVLRPVGQGIARIYMLHLTGPDTQATAVPSSAAFLLANTAWSPDSSWLFYQGPGQHLWGYQVSTELARSSKTTCCQYAVMATLASPSG
jgi:hypothetical protein